MAFYEPYLSTGTETRAVSDPRESSSAPERRGGNREDSPSRTSEVRSRVVTYVTFSTYAKFVIGRKLKNTHNYALYEPNYALYQPKYA
jgi:hypothetical protein